MEKVRKANDRATKGGRYVYDSVLGEGSYGTVLKARDKELNTVVAVKIIKAKKSIVEFLLFKTPAPGKQGRKEVGLLINLQHDNIIAIRDHFEFQKRMTTGLAIVMDYCSGGNLQERLEKLVAQGERLTEKERLHWYKQFASAMEYIHRRSIAHRDLKPANILLDAADNLKVADVGIAKTLYDELTVGGSCQQYMRTVAGTRPYMAPEVFGEHYGISSDIFSMGLVMFVICELPNPPTPGTCLRGGCLGIYMNSDKVTQTKQATSLLNARNCPSDERELFDNMLQHNYRSRPTAAGVVKGLNDIEIRREERRIEEERRRRMEEERRRRMEEERRRRMEEERRRQEQQAQSLWGWLKSWFT